MSKPLRHAAWIVGVAAIAIACWLWRPSGRPSRTPSTIHPFDADSREAAGVEVVPSRSESESASSSPAVKGGGATRIAVVATDGAPLPDAAVVELLPRSAVRHGTTNAEGILALPHASIATPGAARLLVRSDGHVPKETALPDPRPDELLVTLDEAATIDGRVVVAATGMPVDGASVLAWPTTLRLQAETLRAAVAGVADVECVLTDAQGAFTLDEVRAGERFRLLAGKRGYLSRVGSIVETPTRDLQVLVDELYAVQFRVRDESGAALACNPRLIAYPAPYAEIVGDDGRGRVYLPEPSLILAGIDTTATDDLPTFDPLFVYRSLDGARRSGPVRYRVAWPGYVEESREVHLVSARNGVDTTEIRLRADHSGWGRLDLEFSAPAGFLEPVGSKERPLGVLRLQDERAQSYEFGVWEVPRKPLAIAGIPAGEYRLAFVTAHYGDRWPPLEVGWESVRIGSDPATFFVSLDQLSGVGVDVRNSDGSEYNGRATIFVTQVSGSLRGHEYGVQFFEAPYRIDALPAYAYEVRLVEPWESFESSRCIGFTNVGPGQVARLTLVRAP